MNDNSFVISKTTRNGTPKGVPFQRIKEMVLGKHYALSLVFIGERRAKALNAKYRQKDYVPNVLAFPLSKSEGEIFICTKKAICDAPKFNMSSRAFICYLFIHGLLHLKGYAHGSKMNVVERKLIKRLELV